MKDPVDHVLRPRLPWRSPDDPAITECGYDAAKVKTLTRDEFARRLKDYGRQRTALFTCMTCADTAGRWGTWEDDPRKALSRELEWENRRRHEGEARLKDELLAIAALIDAHREDFESMVVANTQRREWIARKAAHEASK